MALLKASIEWNEKAFLAFADETRSISARLNSLIGKRARQALKKRYLSGQTIDVFGGNRHSSGKGEDGRALISNRVLPKAKGTTIRSRPVNLFENGREYKDGRKYAPIPIFKTHLKQHVMAHMSQYVKEFEYKILNPELDKL